MVYQQVFIHPSTLEPGKFYLRKMNNPDAGRPHPVQFIAYSACPAIVIISDGFGYERCPRAELYLQTNS